MNPHQLGVLIERSDPLKGILGPLTSYSLFEVMSQISQDFYQTFQLGFYGCKEQKFTQIKKIYIYCTITYGLEVELEGREGLRQVLLFVSLKGCRALCVLVHLPHSYLITSLLDYSQFPFSYSFRLKVKLKLLLYATESSDSHPIANCLSLLQNLGSKSGGNQCELAQLISPCQARSHRFLASLDFKKLWPKEWDVREGSSGFQGSIFSHLVPTLQVEQAALLYLLLEIKLLTGVTSQTLDLGIPGNVCNHHRILVPILFLGFYDLEFKSQICHDNPG